LKAPSPSIKRAEHHAVQQLTTKRATYIYREREREDMATRTPKLVKHTLLTRFKDEITREQIDNYINDYTNLLDLIPSMKSFNW
jgi:hypothetical protein